MRRMMVSLDDKYSAWLPATEYRKATSRPTEGVCPHAALPRSPVANQASHQLTPLGPPPALALAVVRQWKTEPGRGAVQRSDHT